LPKKYKKERVMNKKSSQNLIIEFKTTSKGRQQEQGKRGALVFWYSLFIFLVAIISFKSGFSQLNLAVNNNPLQLVQTIVGAGYNVSNAKLNCPTGAIGTFTNVTSNIGITDGIILTSGSINIAQGPNNNVSAGVNNGTNGDFDLDNLSGTSTYDGCALEFDLVPACDTLKIDYVFGSEEYPEYVNKQFNDVFAFFISGPGIVGTQNIALVPTTTLPVSINNINAGNNAAYFVNNAGGTTIQYDGFTKPLTAKAVVQPCKKYHLKIVIADVLDGIFDSGVFIKGNTIECSPVSYNDLASNLNAIKTCANGGFTFCRTGDTSQPFTVNYNVSGTAVNGVDYQTLPGSIVIPANQKCAATTVVPIIDPNRTGTKTVKIAYQYGFCPQWDTITLYISDPPPIDAGPDVSFCSGDSIKIGNSPQPTLNYSWQPTNGLSNPNISNPTVKLTNSSNTDVVAKYVLTVTNPLSATCVMKDSLLVTVKAIPKAQFNTLPGYCVGANVNFTDGSVAPSGKSITTWYWDFGNSLFDVIKNPVIKYTSGGTYTVKLVVTDNGGCKHDTSFAITVWPSPVVSFTNTSACTGDSVRFTNTSAVAGGTIQQSIWDFGDLSSLVNTTSPAHMFPVASASYTVKLIVTSNNNCVSSTQKTVSLNPKPTAAFSSTLACIYDQIKYSNFSTGNNSTWDFGDGSSSTLRNPSHKFNTLGNHQVKLVTSTNFGCADSIIKTVGVFDTPKFDFSAVDTAGCPSFCTQYTANVLAGSDSVVSWNWLFNTGDVKYGQSLSYCYTTDGKYSPVLIATSNQGCVDTITKLYYIHVYPKPKADFDLSPTEISIYESTVQINNHSSMDINKWLWDLGDNQTYNAATPLPHKYANADHDYTVTLKVENKYGCKDSTERRVTYKAISDVYIPNAFSPNGDGVNEIFRPYCSGIFETADFVMDIYDRWGLRLLKTTDINKGWDGIYRDRVCEQDIYYYRALFYDKSSGNLLQGFSGFVALVR
jgi:gliding motility-associated-like protein